MNHDKHEVSPSPDYTCSRCGGSGTVSGKTCPICGGSGQHR